MLYEVVLGRRVVVTFCWCDLPLGKLHHFLDVIVLCSNINQAGQLLASLFHHRYGRPNPTENCVSECPGSDWWISLLESHVKTEVLSLRLRSCKATQVCVYPNPNERSILIPEILLLVEQICPRGAQIDNLGTAIAILL